MRIRSFFPELLLAVGILTTISCSMTSQVISPSADLPTEAIVRSTVSVPTEMVRQTSVFTSTPTLMATLKAAGGGNMQQSAATVTLVPGSTPKPVVPPTAVPPTLTFTPGPTSTSCASWVIWPPIPSEANGTALCAQPVVMTSAAAQYFEGGAMLWLKTPGIYYLLTNKGGFYSVYDPLTTYRDTSAQYVPPAGLYAPVSGFGLVWRGDYLPDGSPYASELSTYRQSLGWATAVEFGYQTTYQCGNYTCTGCTENYCTLSYPDGRPILVTHLPMIYGGEWKFAK